MSDDEETGTPMKNPAVLEQIARRDPTVITHYANNEKPSTRRCFFCDALVGEYRDQRNLPIIAPVHDRIPQIAAVIHRADCLWQQARNDLDLTGETVDAEEGSTASDIHHFVVKPTP